MASVVRIKRRRDDDPAETLLLSCKKLKHSDLSDVDSVLSFAGTINSKKEPVSQHIKEAIKQRKLHKELHPHSASFKQTSQRQKNSRELRREREQASSQNRYRVTWSRRALDLDLLDKENVDGDSSPSEESANPLISGKGVSKSSTEDKENFRTDPISPPADTENPSSFSAHDSPNGCHAIVKEDKMFCIFDVENENPLITETETSGSGITMNNVPMVSERVTDPAAEDSDFVYDLYYTHSNLTDLDMETVLTVEAICHGLVNDRDGDNGDGESVNEDSDDSNDECNWRNDYPDEDPRFFENEEEDYAYEEDMVDTGFLNDDEGDLLAYWMSSRLNVDKDSDDEEEQYDKEEGDSSELSDY